MSALTAEVEATGDEIRECIEACSECHRICVATLAVALRKTARKLEPDQARLLLDCAQACDVAVDFMLRGSELQPVMTRACATIAEKCATVCDAVGGDGPLKACAARCRHCAESCRKVAEAN